MGLKIGIIGIGEIGSMFLDDFITRYKKENILISSRTISKLDKYKDKATILTNKEVASLSDILILAVKPQNILDLSIDIRESLNKKALIISSLAGVKINKLKDLFSHNDIIRILPNTPCRIKKGTILYTSNSDFSKLVEVKELFQIFGDLIYLNEKYMELGSVSVGSMPAFVYKIVDSYIKASVKYGMEEQFAEEFIKKTFVNSILYSNSSNKSLLDLTNEVAVKGGSTIEGIKKLEELQIDALIDESFKACLEKTIELGEE